MMSDTWSFWSRPSVEVLQHPVKIPYGVEYTACSNTMQVQGLTLADLIDQVDRTMPAIIHLMKLQEQRWANIKP